MNRFSLSHQIECSAGEFWQTFLDESFTVRHFLDGVRFSEYRIVRQQETDGNIERTVEAMPQVQLPKPIARLFGAGFRYVEQGVFDKQSRVFRFRTTPSALADRIHNEGTIRVEALPSGAVRRVIELTIDVRIAVLGASMESLAEKTLREGWDASARFMNSWLAAHRPRATS